MGGKRIPPLKTTWNTQTTPISSLKKTLMNRCVGALGKCDIDTETRELNTQWVNVLLLFHSEREPTSELPPPFDQIKFSARGTIIRHAIYMKGKLDNALEERI